MTATGVQIVIDCADPDRLADFWAAALHYRKQDPPEGFASWPEFLTAQGVTPEHFNDASAVVDPGGAGPRIFFQRVPEPKQVKNRLHLDLNVGGGYATAPQERRSRIAAEVQRLVGHGASHLRDVEERGEFHAAMRDPEGNEFDIQ